MASRIESVSQRSSVPLNVSYGILQEDRAVSIFPPSIKITHATFLTVPSVKEEHSRILLKRVLALILYFKSVYLRVN